MPSSTKEETTAQAPEQKYAATTWGGEIFEDLVVPSGQVCQVRRPGVQGLIRDGILESLDSLTGIVQNELIPSAKGTAKKAIDPQEIMKNPESVVQIMHLTDRIITHVVVQPQIEMSPNDVTRRKQGVIYADMIDIDDKMFILNYAVGGARDLERFREESEKALGTVDSESTTEGDTESTP